MIIFGFPILYYFFPCLHQSTENNSTEDTFLLAHGFGRYSSQWETQRQRLEREALRMALTRKLRRPAKQSVEPSKAAPSDILLPAWSNFLTPPQHSKQGHMLENKTQDCGDILVKPNTHLKCISKKLEVYKYIYV